MKKALVLLFSVDEFTLDQLDEMNDNERFKLAVKEVGEGNADIYTLADFLASINNGEDCLSEWFCYQYYAELKEYEKWYK